MRETPDKCPKCSSDTPRTDAIITKLTEETGDMYDLEFEIGKIEKDLAKEHERVEKWKACAKGLRSLLCLWDTQNHTPDSIVAFDALMKEEQK